MFDYFVSLGPNCATAASMSKYGLRSFSGPFDWLVTDDLSWVLHYIQTEFKDFLRCDNLEPYQDYRKKFCEKDSGFIFIHEKSDYRTEFAALKEKYERRIQKFLLAIHKRTCFLRMIINQDQLDYVENHAAYIENTLCKYNSQNKIVFLIKKELKIPENFPFLAYKTQRSYSVTNFNTLRAVFDGNAAFLDFCGENFSGSDLMRNLMFDSKREFYENQLLEQRYRTLSALSLYDFSKEVLPPETIIYGAGKLGQALYKKIQPYTHVKYFLDRSKYGKEYEGIPVYSLNDLASSEKGLVIVATTYDFEAVKEDIHRKCETLEVASLDDIMGLEAE